MGIDDKLEQVKGKAKEEIGDATDNEQMEGEGKADQVSGKVKDKVDDIKDKLS